MITEIYETIRKAKSITVDAILCEDSIYRYKKRLKGFNYADVFIMNDDGVYIHKETAYPRHEIFYAESKKPFKIKFYYASLLKYQKVPALKHETAWLCDLEALYEKHNVTSIDTCGCGR